MWQTSIYFGIKRLLGSHFTSAFLDIAAAWLDWSFYSSVTENCFYHFFHSDVTRTSWAEGRERSPLKRQDTVFRKLTRPSHILQMCTHISLSSCSPTPGCYYFHKGRKKKRQADGATKWWLGLQSWSWPDCFQVINGSNHRASDCLLFFHFIGQNWLCS